MPKYKIRAHYDPGTVSLGTVEAESQNAALIVAEEMGLLDDPDAVDWTATLVVPAQPLGSYRDQMQDAGRGHLLRDGD